MRVLVLNAGSATLKATVVDPPDRSQRFSTTEDWDGAADAVVGAVVRATAGSLAPDEPIDGVGHRVVHGGDRFTSPTLLDNETLRAIETLADLAPLHNPLAVSVIRAARDALPDVPHLAAFDTAFHASLPEAAARYPVPTSWLREAGVRRYGFHGLSVDWATRRAAELLGRRTRDLRLVVAHLGGGCSVTAVDGGRSVDTSMGMTPLEGLMMGTRAGSIDPGIVFRLLRHGRSAVEIEEDLDRRSGLVGVAGTADVADLLVREARGDATAQLALEMFVRRAAAGMAAAATALPSIDAIVFTGGIGQHADAVTERIRERLHLIGSIESSQVHGEDRIDRPATGPAVLRIAAREDLVIAESVAAMVRRS